MWKRLNNNRFIVNAKQLERFVPKCEAKEYIVNTSYNINWRGTMNIGAATLSMGMKLELLSHFIGHRTNIVSVNIGAAMVAPNSPEILHI